MKFSKTTGCFYPEDIAYTTFPVDLIDVPQKDFDAAMGRASGDTLDLIDNRIVIVPTPAPKHDDLVAQTLTTARQMRLPIIGILDGMQSSALTEGDLPRAQAIELAKLGLKNITKVDLSTCTTAEEMQTVILTAYMTIAKAAPDTVQTAFAQVLA